MVDTDPDALLPHLFRNEYSRIVATLVKRFGLDQIEIAEDLAAETFLTATQTWGVGGIPANPTAWLYQVAKNKAINYLKREARLKAKITTDLTSPSSDLSEPSIDLSEKNIHDSVLQMIFVVCHPSISAEAQISLALRVLCGFGIDEIAAAFLVNKETVHKRLFRAKEKLREAGIQMEIPGETHIESRLDNVMTILYLLFNEGYYSVSQNRTIRKDLCLEAIRLGSLLIENKNTNLPAVNALMSLMCFHISRFEARIDKNGELILYEDQDTALWNPDWIHKGGYFLHQASRGQKISKYHLEAGIAYWHTQKTDDHEKWEAILQLYNQLLQLEYSPVAALNRTYALSMVKGPEQRLQAIEEAKKLNLVDNQFYFILLGELYSGIDPVSSKNNYLQAMSLCRTAADKLAIRKKLDKLVYGKPG